MFQRARSTSVATGNSAASNDSSRLPTHDDTDGTKGVSRLRRDTVDGISSAGIPSAPGSSIGDHGTDSASTKQAEEVPWFLQPDSPPEDIMLNPNGQVKGATLAALMERLTMHNAFDSSFNSTFLMTYRSFTTTEILLDLLFARFRIQEPDGLTLDEHEMWIEKKQRPIRFRVFNVLKSWLESHFQEDEDEEHMKRIRAFALDEMAHSPAMNMPANLLLRIIERRSGTGEQMKITMVMPASAPPPILPKNFRKIKFLDIDPLEMARQLTLMDSRLYNRIRPSECLGKAWSRDSGAWKAKGVRDVIGANNRVSGWVSEAILVQEDVKKRAAWVKHFVAIADRCFYLNNFSSMMAIYSGLNNASLNRLRRTWDAVNQRHLQLFENMRAILAPTRNFTKYRETLRKLNPPCVPFLGVYLTDLTFIEDGNTDRLRTDDRLINFSKRQMTAEKIQEIMIYQSTPYNLTPVPGLQKFIEENLIEARSDDELFEQSLRLEPREREDEKIARLLQESGFL
ncbi:ras GEF [Meira miltonrushii]|uniref:Ras GEF n=1 Tax=Meira miltonrushii TaxID=1280837 RepID=A0A316VE42_9BASI|nr:ras GEF [Meira miltonrushii]PWN34271.1 ras GEF [Meira miltonrushii]